MKRLLLYLYVFVFSSAVAYAIPAYPYKVKVATKYGYVSIAIKGDESLKYGMTDEGHTVVQDSLGWFYLCRNSVGEIVKSNYMLEASDALNSETKLFLEKTPKGLCPEFCEDNSIFRSNKTVRKTTTNLKKAVVGSRKVLIVLMQYTDCRFKKTKSDFVDLFNKQGYNDDGAFGSVNDYYKKVSYGQLDLQCDVYGPYAALHNMSYYGENLSSNGNDRNSYALFEEAIRNVAGVVNLADYDGDNDGYLDNIHIIYSGYGEEAGAPSYTIWAHELSFPPISVNGIMIDHYSCSPELRGNSGSGITRIGAPCHEIGHALGANDYYDVNNQTGGYYEGTGDWDIMASGSWNNHGANPADFNPYVKIHDFGWIQPVELNCDSLVTMTPSESNGVVYKLNTPVENDYYLLENRYSSGITAAEPGHGLLVFHIGPNIERKSVTNTINATFPQECYLVNASALYPIPVALPASYGIISSAGCPFPGSNGNTEFSANTTPMACSQSGKKANFSISNITLSSDGNITFVFAITEGTNEDPDSPVEDEDPPAADANIVWNDDFEGFNKTSTWSQQQIEGTSLWENVITSIGDYSDKMPEPISGHGYIVLKHQTMGIGGNEGSFIGKLISPIIVLPNKKQKYHVSGYYRLYDPQKLPTAKVCLCIKDADLIDRGECYELPSVEKNSWMKFSVNITDISNVQLALEGELKTNSMLFVDNVIITSEDTEDSQSSPTVSGKVTIFSLNGFCLYKEVDLKNVSLPKGIYLLKQGGTTSKIIKM